MAFEVVARNCVCWVVNVLTKCPKISDLSNADFFQINVPDNIGETS